MPQTVPHVTQARIALEAVNQKLRTAMHLFKNTMVAAHKLRVQATNFRRNLAFDIFQHVINPAAAKLRPFGLTDPIKKILDGVKPRKSRPGSLPPDGRPSIFVSYATDESLKGSHRYCGGEKLLNNLVLLLRRHGYDAYMVSMDGVHSNWLVEHAPFLSVEEFARRAAGGHPIRCVTSWVLADAFLAALPRILLLGSRTGHHEPKPVSGARTPRCATGGSTRRPVLTVQFKPGIWRYSNEGPPS